MKKFISQTKVQVGGFNPVQPPGEVRIKLSNYYYLHLISVSPGMGSPILISVFFLIPPHATLSMSPSFVAQQQWAQLSNRGGQDKKPPRVDAMALHTSNPLRGRVEKLVCNNSYCSPRKKKNAEEEEEAKRE